jgi:tetratricopeptide (TPR) repeat protein
MLTMIKQNWQRVLLAIIILVICSLNKPASSAEFKVGQIAIVIKDNVEFKEGDKVVNKASIGQVIEVGQYNKGWIWVLSSKGWIHEKNVLDLKTIVAQKTESIKKKPTPLDYHLRGIAYHHLKKHDEAISDLSVALKSDPKNYAILVNRGNTYWVMGKNDLAIADFSSAIKLNNKNAVMYHNRGVIYTIEKKYDLAISDINKALELDSKYADAYKSRGVLFRSQGKYGLAMIDYNKAIELNPYMVSAFEQRAYIWTTKKDYTRAVDDFNKALHLNGKSKVALNDLAWILSTCPDEKLRDGKRAVELALKGCKLTEYKDWNRLDTLSAAYAEAGNFEKAVEWIKKTIELAPQIQKQALKKKEALYQSQKPLRE